MTENRGFEKFVFPKTEISRHIFDKRLRNVACFLGWQAAANRVIKSGIQFEKLRIIEIGCGTGTFCLAFALLGAQITLFDIDKDALENARQVYSLYGLTPKVVKSSVLEPVPEELSERFDMAVSIGLAEHFKSDERAYVINFHKQLINANGFAVIGCPNRISPFYVVVRALKTLLGQWTIETELPFTPAELKYLGKISGYTDISIVGNHSLYDDFCIYSKAFISSLSKLLPQKIRNLVKKPIEPGTTLKEQNIEPDISTLKKYILKCAYPACHIKASKAIKDLISSGLYLIGK